MLEKELIPHNYIDDTFERLKAANHTGLIVYLTVGFPDIEATVDLVLMLADAGVDIVELGVPFSDPLADGITIQKSNFHALEHGVSMEMCLEVVESVKKQVPKLPLVLMGYYNPVLTYGLSRFVGTASEVGADGTIVVDLPSEEAQPLKSACLAHGLHLIPLLAPTSTDVRIRDACEQASGFIYCVNVTGVTGSRQNVPNSALTLLERVRTKTNLPLAAGFGVSTAEHVRTLGRSAQAAVVGSEFIKLIDQTDPKDRMSAVNEFVSRIKGSATQREAS